MYDLPCPSNAQVHLGRVSGLNLAGLAGAVPLVRLVGPVTLGPGPVERSSAVAPHGVAVYVDPLASLMQKQLVLELAVQGATLTAVQVGLWGRGGSGGRGRAERGRGGRERGVLCP